MFVILKTVYFFNCGFSSIVTWTFLLKKKLELSELNTFKRIKLTRVAEMSFLKLLHLTFLTFYKLFKFQSLA